MKKTNSQTKAGRKKQTNKPPKPDIKKQRKKTINKTQLDRKK